MLTRVAGIYNMIPGCTGCQSACDLILEEIIEQALRMTETARGKKRTGRRVQKSESGIVAKL
jgi:hypothetical protein